MGKIVEDVVIIVVIVVSFIFCYELVRNDAKVKQGIENVISGRVQW